jgi:hypothetical protein
LRSARRGRILERLNELADRRPQLAIEARWAEGRIDRLPALMHEVGRKST